jgi:alpha-beta hydrolase superfamily lysophospholipase
MILPAIVALALVAGLLAVVTAIGTVAIERRYPPAGRFVDLAGARLHVLELGRAADDVPIVLLHGASGNLQDMRLGLGEALAQRHRVILLDRPGHGWSGRPGRDADADPPGRPP